MLAACQQCTKLDNAYLTTATMKNEKDVSLWLNTIKDLSDEFILNFLE